MSLEHMLRDKFLGLPSGKSDRTWYETREWCEKHPEQVAAVVTPQGTFRVTFTPKQDTLRGQY